LGINWQAIGAVGSIAAFPAITSAINAPGCVVGAITGLLSKSRSSCQGAGFNGIIDALAQDNLARILTEPNLTVMSGQSASFLVGGEFPIPVGQQNGQITVAFKNFGVTL